jgi:uncharacterized protein (TIGR03546 family)
MFQTIRPLRFLAQALTVESSPRQLAIGFALGVMIGLVPKGNLIAFSLTVVLFATRVNLGIGLATAIGVSFLAPLTDRLTHGLGARVLSNEAIQTLLGSLYQRPVIPWTSLNNTVVVGGLLLGIVLFYPLYHLSESIFRWLLPRITERLKQFRLYHVLLGTDLATRWRIG